MRVAFVPSVPDEEQAPQSQLLTQLGALASMVVHDMGSPLSASLLHASVLLRRLEREGADELVHEFRETLRSGSEHRAEIDLISLVERARRLLEADAAQRGVRLWLEAGDDRPFVRGNAGQLLRVIDNVIRNALEAADRGGEWFLEPGVPSGTVVRIQLPVAEPE